MKASRKSYHVPAAARALLMLEALADMRRGQTLSSLADRLKIPRPSCLRLMSTLETMQYVRQDAETGLYVMTGKVAHLAARRMRSYDLRDVAYPMIRDLHHASGETVELAVRDGDAALIIDRVEATEGLRIHLVVGSRIPLPMQHTGRAILAALPVDECERILSDAAAFFKNAPRDMTLQRLRAELEQTRVDGFAHGTGLRRPEVTRVAAVVRDVSGHPAAAVGLAGPTFRMAERIRELGKAVVKTAQRLTAEGIALP